MLCGGYFSQLCLIGCVLLSVNLLGTAEKDAFKLRLPPHPARIYTQAPEGVQVTVIRAAYSTLDDDSLQQDCAFRYRLQELDDFELFKISECDGTIETAKKVDKSVGENFYIAVTAHRNNSNHTASTRIPIEVTQYNKRGPTLTHSHYSQEILDVAPIGTTLLTLNGTDEYGGKSNKTLYYFIQSLSTSGLNPWLYPTVEPMKINHSSGEIKVSAPLFGLPESMLFYIGVADDGSPQRSQTSKLTLHIRNMSAPRNVKVVSTSEQSINLCWSPPVLGLPDGYRITYNTRKNIALSNTKAQGVSNVTVEDLYKIGQVYRGYGSNRQKVDSSVDRSITTNLTYCSSLDGLNIFTFYVVKLTGWSAGGRLSMTSSPLAVVTKKRDCSEDLCNKGICQEQRSPPGYKCVCVDGFTGPHCADIDPCSAEGFTCNNGKCKWSEDSPVHCVCNENFFGDQCQWVKPCGDETCHNSGTCVAETSEVYHCNCPPLYTGTHCEIHLEDVSKLYSDIDSSCSNVTTSHDFGNLVWPLTKVGEEVSVDCWMEQNGDVILEKVGEQATRNCQRDSSGRPFWTDPTIESCTAAGNDTTSIVEKVNNFGRYVNFPKSPNISNEMLKSAIHDMSHIISERFNREKGEKVSMVLNNILNIDKLKLRSSKEFRQSTGRLLNVFKTFTQNIDLKVGESFNMREDTFFLSTKVLSKLDLPPEISFPLGSKGPTLEKNFFRIPKSAVSGVIGEEIRFKFVSFIDDRLFVDSVVNRSLNMPVFSVSVGNESIYNIDPPVTYKVLGLLKDNYSATCVFWDESDNSWSSKGIRTVISSDSGVLCESSHLTAFSVLLDPIHTDIGSHHSKILSVITYIGLALSTVALVITVATFALFRSLRKDRSGLIVVNLSIALLLLNFCFIFATALPGNQTTCLFFAVLLHYSVASTFAWMLIEALNMHQLLITVFPSVETHFLLKRLFLGWICPLFFVGLALLWNHQVYMNDSVDICVISPSFAPAVYYTTYLAPIILVLTVNCVIFGLVTKVLCEARPDSSVRKYPNRKFSRKKTPVTLAQIRGAITVVALLGVTWTNGTFAIGSTRIIFQYIFCITTPLQGFVIFLVRVVQNSDARSSWYKFLFYDIRGRQERPTSSVRSQSSYQNMSLNTQSTNSTLQKSVFTSTGLRAAVRRLSSTSSNYLTRNKGSAKETRRHSSGPLKDGRKEVQLANQNSCKLDNNLHCIINDNATTKLASDLYSNDTNVSQKLNQCDDEQLHGRAYLDEQPDVEKINLENCKDSLLISNFEDISDRNLLSGDLTTSVLSNILSLRRKSSEINNADEKGNGLGKTLLNTTAFVSTEANLAQRKSVLNARSDHALEKNVGELKEVSMLPKSKSLHQIESFKDYISAQSPVGSNLIRFLSESTLDKIKT